MKLSAAKVKGPKDCFPRGTSPGRAKDNVAQLEFDFHLLEPFENKKTVNEFPERFP